MFKHILVPVDLRLPDPVSKALDVAMEMARIEGARMTLVNVSGGTSGETYNDDAAEEVITSLAKKIEGKIAGQADGVKVEGITVHSNDVSAEVDGILARTVDETGADLVIAGSHAPRLLDYITTSHAGYLVRHSKASVFVVR
ncbi:universal stress protein [Leisingera caerulea]|uniref:universal stress protein n=1 Tax=Leisingera caerulea TaxID=506591 RepID=UPI0021A90993|nr:universal stress protein [Leisingera caerulea]UWQ62847.1 universal stress protein [Leisingera caerulea]